MLFRVDSRPYIEPDDLRLMQRLAQEVWRLDPALVEATVGELAWGTRQHVGRESEWERRLWFEDGDLVACSRARPRWNGKFIRSARS